MTSKKRNLKRIHDDNANYSLDMELLKDPYEIISEPSNICTQIDHIRKKNCTKNPWCLYGLGELKEGIWKQDISEYVEDQIGDEKLFLIREKQMSNSELYYPAGLKNYGATCYLNALIQSFYHNLLIQEYIVNIDTNGIVDYMGKPTISDPHMTNVMFQLQLAFAHMQSSPCKLVHLGSFIELLGLNKCAQQDPQEFIKLFLAKIERMHPTLRSSNRLSFSELFTGQLEYITVCSFCNNKTLRSHSFHELDMSIEGYASLEAAIKGYSASEALCVENQNQYECNICNCKRNAMRYTFIRKAPTVLSFHLLRYVYDRTTFERKKLQSTLSFPNVLEWKDASSDSKLADINSLLDEDDESVLYRLVSVLYHKGQSAYGGHYVCDVLDWETETWFHCDDEQITPTENPTNSFVDSKIINNHDSSAVTDNVIEIIDVDEDRKKSKGKRKIVIDLTETTDKPFIQQSVAATVGRDACILNYVKVSEFNKKRSNQSKFDKRIESILNNNSSKFLQDVEKYQSLKLKIKAQIAHRKDIYLQIGNQLTPNKIPSIATSKFHLIPSDWLKKWITGDPSTFIFMDEVNSFSSLRYHSSYFGYNNDGNSYGVGPSESTSEVQSGLKILLNNEIPTAEYICSHGFGMNTEVLSSFKILSNYAFAAIFTNDSSDPNNNSTRGRVSYNFDESNFRCDFCFNNVVASRQKSSEVLNRHSKILKMIDHNTSSRLCSDQDDDNDIQEGKGYWLSKNWIQQLRKYTNTYLAKKQSHQHQKTPKLNSSQCNHDSNNTAINTEYNLNLKSLYPDPHVNTNIYCDQHKMLSNKYQKKVMRICQDTWFAVLEEYPNAIEIRDNAISCVYCQENEEKEYQIIQDSKAIKSKEIESSSHLLQLSKMKFIYPSIFNDLNHFQHPEYDDETYYAVDGIWLSHWRRYIKEPSFPNPGPLTNTRIRCYCNESSALISDILSKIISDGIHQDEKKYQVYKFEDQDLGMISYSSNNIATSLPIFELITHEQWNALLRIYSPSNFEQPCNDNGESSSSSNSIDENIFKLQMTWDKECKQWLWSPAVCVSCVENVKAMKMKSLSNFVNASMKVSFIRNPENLQSVIEESGVVHFQNSSKSKEHMQSSHSLDNCSTVVRIMPARAARRNTKAMKASSTIYADCSDTIALLKLKIFEAFTCVDLPPNSQLLYRSNGAPILEGITSTLNDCNIKSDDIIYVVKKVSTDLTAYDDYEECFHAHLMTSSSADNTKTEQGGFSGTTLV